MARYQNNTTSEIITAYLISSVGFNGEGYSISLPDLAKSFGLDPSVTANYVPVQGDYYRDNADAPNSVYEPLGEIISSSDMENDWTYLEE